MEILKTTFLGLIFGTFGTTIGGLIGISLKKISNKFLSFILSLASGIMLSIICFDLVPQAFICSNIINILLGIILGALAMIACDTIVKNKIKSKNTNINNLFKTGIVISIGLAIHNIPEGLAIGTGFENSLKLGYSLAIAIVIHDIPEGISMSAPMKKSGISSGKILLYVLLSGITSGIGTLIGSLIGNISDKIMSLSLAFAAGAMLYIVSGELVPEANKLYSGKLESVGNILGFVLGFIATQI